jgi:2-dehydro-3-deoxyphosphogluconate aldolase/(4S)-4-hydroxy-2-oxoglutarate aldolase
MNKNEIIDYMSKSGVVGVFRTDDTDKLIPASIALHKGGISCIEYTMTMPNASRLIEDAVNKLPGDIIIGAGTVLDSETARIAILSGAKFVVSPLCDLKMIELCHRYGVPIMPGALTPSEIMLAWRNGADMVKIFPVSSVGSEYIKHILGPFPSLRLMATGEITAQNIKEYIAAGIEVVGVGGHFLDPRAFAEGRFEVLTGIAQKLVNDVYEARKVI